MAKMAAHRAAIFAIAQLCADKSKQTSASPPKIT